MATIQRFSGSKIREARHSARMTQAALAHAVGTRERNIIRWENNQHSPRFENVAAIAAATGQDISFFVADAPHDEDDDEESDTVRALMDALRRVVREEMQSKTLERT